MAMMAGPLGPPSPGRHKKTPTVTVRGVFSFRRAETGLGSRHPRRIFLERYLWVTTFMESFNLPEIRQSPRFTTHNEVAFLDDIIGVIDALGL